MNFTTCSAFLHPRSISRDSEPWFGLQTLVEAQASNTTLHFALPSTLSPCSLPFPPCKPKDQNPIGIL